jgi:hypothetical protein
LLVVQPFRAVAGRFDHYGGAQPFGRELEHDQIRHPTVDRVCDTFDLVGERQMNKAFVSEALAERRHAVGTFAACVFPVVGQSDVKEPLHPSMISLVGSSGILSLVLECCPRPEVAVSLAAATLGFMLRAKRWFLPTAIWTEAPGDRVSKARVREAGVRRFDELAAASCAAPGWRDAELAHASLRLATLILNPA